MAHLFSLKCFICFICQRPRRLPIHEMNFIHKLEPKIEKLSLFHKSRQPTEQTRHGHNSHNPTRRNTSAGFKTDAKSGSTLNESRGFKLGLGLKDFVIQKVIGRGSFGKVLLVTRTPVHARPGQGGEFYALKCIKKDSILQDDNVGSIMVERDILKLGSKNPFITRSEAAFQNEVR